MSSSFIIYDLETGGLDSKLDRIMQFAGIRVDENLNIVGDPLLLHCKLPSFYIPNPTAVETTGITKEECEEKGLPEYIFAKQIHDFFTKQPNTVIMGYNNIKFDDEFMRNLFYRNYLSPYGYSFKNYNSRWDIINLVRATYEILPEGINWCFNEDGTPTFRLEVLTKANNISHENAHDALSDVMATLEVMRLIKEKQPSLFKYAFNLRLAKQVQSLFESTDTLLKTPAVHVNGSGLHLLTSIYSSSETGRVFFDLTANNEKEFNDKKSSIDLFVNSSVEELSQSLYKPKDKQLSLKVIRDNSCPFYCSTRVLKDNEKNKNLLKNYQLLLEYLKSKLTDMEIQEKVIELFKNSHFDKGEFVEQQLYDGFFSNEEEMFRSKLSNMLGNEEVNFNDILNFFNQSNLFHNNQRHCDLFKLFVATHFLNELTLEEQEILEKEVILPRKLLYEQRVK